VHIYVDVDVPDATREQLLPREPPSTLSDITIQSVTTELYAGARELFERQTANEAEWVGLLNVIIHRLILEICKPPLQIYHFHILTEDERLASCS
jgi:hypothetical protein